MLKHRQVTVHITHLSVFGFNRDPTVNLRHTGWKDWQLHLWHAFSYQPLATYATIFRLILISSTTRKSPASSGATDYPLLVAVSSGTNPCSGRRFVCNDLRQGYWRVRNLRQSTRREVVSGKDRLSGAGVAARQEHPAYKTGPHGR